MRASWIWIAAMTAAACTTAESDRPQRNGGGPGGGMGGGNGGGAADAAGISNLITGTVCIASDLRTPTACTTRAGAGVVVTNPATGATTTTDANGAFTLDLGNTIVPTALLDVGVGSPQVVPTLTETAVGAPPVLIPIANANDLTTLETGLGTTLPDGFGAVALHLVDANGAGAVGFTLTPAPGTGGGPFFDDTSTLGFAANGTTGVAGRVLLFGVPIDATSTTILSVTNGTFSADVTVPVAAGHLTFATTTVTTTP